jgi:hypothetical protein
MPAVTAGSWGSLPRQTARQRLAPCPRWTETSMPSRCGSFRTGLARALMVAVINRLFLGWDRPWEATQQFYPAPFCLQPVSTSAPGFVLLH